MSKAKRIRKPVEPLTAAQKREFKVVAIILAVLLGGFAAIVISLPFWQHGAFPRELAESTPNSVFEVEDGSSGEWAYLDEDLELHPFEECVRIDGRRLTRPWQCTSADESRVFVFRGGGRRGSTIDEETLSVLGEKIPMECAITGE